jgi:hypothetical protein
MKHNNEMRSSSPNLSFVSIDYPSFPARAAPETIA